MFFIPFDNWKSLFFVKVSLLLWDSFSHHIVAFYETSVLKGIHILHYLHNAIAALIPKFQTKAIEYFTS